LKQDNETLIEILKGSKDIETRIEAIELLGASKNPLVVKSLIEVLKKNDSFINHPVAVALARIGSPLVIEELLKLLKNGDERLRGEVTKILGKIGNPIAIKPLLDILQDPDSLVRYFSIEALIKITVTDNRVKESIINTLNDKDPLVRRVALDSIMKLELMEPFNKSDLFIKYLDDTDPAIRIKAAQLLGKMKQQSSVKYLVNKLQDDDKLVREEVIKVLGDIADPRTIKPLINIIRDKKDLSWEATEALGKIGSSAVEDLLVLLKDSETDVRPQAAISLGVIKDQRSVIPLILALNDEKWLVQEEAKESLINIGEIIVDPLIEMLIDKGMNEKDEGMRQVLKILIHFDPTKEQIEPLKPLLLALILSSSSNDVSIATRLLKKLN
jgi:HEAT repeat protein